MNLNVRIVLVICLFGSASHCFPQSALLLPKNGQVYVIAHRGAHDGIPENSLAAYQKAIDLGCDFVEIDLRSTRDNKYVSIHNATIDAYVVGKSAKVSEMTLAELRQLDIGIRHGEQWRNTKIPTFEEILQLCQGKIGIYLDLKDADPPGLIALIRKYGMTNHVIWYVPGYRHKTIMEIKRECPGCIIMPDPGEEKNLERVLVAYSPLIVASTMRFCSASFCATAHGKESLVFTDESKESLQDLHSEWKTMLEWQVDGIQTDQPAELIKFVVQHSRTSK